MNIIDIWFILIPAVFLPFAIRKPIISAKNYAMLMVVVPLLIGALLIRYSVEMEYIDYSAIKKSAWLISIALTIYLSTVIFLYKKIKKIPLKGVVNDFGFHLLQHWENISDIRLLTIFFVFSFLGSLVIWLTFFKTGNIPYCNTANDSAKYFKGFTDLYISLRPFYNAGQQLLAIVNLVVLIAIITTNNIKRVLFLIPLYLFNFLTLVLTLKRGEITFGLDIIIIAIIISRKVPKSVFVITAVVFLIMIYAVIITEPSRSNRPFLEICSEGIIWDQIVFNPEKGKKAQSKDTEIKLQRMYRNIIPNRGEAVKVLINVFGIQIRDSARLIYHFERQDSKLLKGKTFLAGFLGFIPTEYFPFKEKYQIGRVSLRFFGINPDISGGPRIGLVGETYINFGYLGVFLIPIFAGFLAWYLGELSDISQEIGSGRKMIFITCIFLFFINHIVIGFFGGGSAAFQTFIIRTAIMAVVFFLLFYPVKRAKT